MSNANVTPRGLRNQNVSLIDKLKAKQRQLKESFSNMKRGKSKTPELKRGKVKTPKLRQGKENVHPGLCAVTIDPRSNNTSTPVENTLRGRRTPKSILKKRKIIDDNIKVDVPIRGPNLRSSNFNNASNNNNRLMIPSSDIQLPNTPFASFSLDDPRYSASPDISEPDDENYGPTPCKIKKNVSFNFEDAAEKRLVDPGNVRTLKPKSSEQKKMGGLFKSKSRKTPKKNITTPRRPQRDALKHDEVEKDKVGPLLGYDWIAGFLDNDPRITGLSDEYLEDLKEFRRVNKEECISRLQVEPVRDESRTPSPVIRDPEHTCIHTYAVNSRLFTVPMNANSNGESMCPICAGTRRRPTSYSPGFVRISIPQGALREPYQKKAHRRRSFDPSDSYALTEHCLAGWQNARPAQMPTAASVDLRYASGRQKSKQPTTLAEAEEMAHSTKKKIQEVHYNNTRRSFRSIASDKLLNTSHALRYNLQCLEKAGPASQRAPNSTSFPLY